MRQKTLYRVLGAAMLLLIRSSICWGSEKLPQLSVRAAYNIVLSDTLPPTKPGDKKDVKEVKVEDPEVTQTPVKEIVEPVIKEVPKSKKQLKPAALPNISKPVKLPKVVKPKVVIKKVASLL